MRALARIAVVAAVSFAAVMVVGQRPSSAQIPDEYKNLKILPKDITKRDLVPIMRSMSQALGVRCVECHVSTKAGSERLEDLDFAAEDKPDKETARQMMRMVGSINEQIDKIGLKEPAKVGCMTCHHGVKKPETLSAVMMHAMDKGGVEAAAGRYRELRDKYYGAAAYDFSPFALVEIAGEIAESKKDFDGAIHLLELNLEFNPDHAGTYVSLGQVQMVKGDKAAAIVSFEQAIKLEPENRWAKQQLERAKSDK